jgi:signal transduction histidine kinase
MFYAHERHVRPGTGLGLAIARKAIEDHGGKIEAENLNPGLRVNIELPIRG